VGEYRNSRPHRRHARHDRQSLIIRLAPAMLMGMAALGAYSFADDNGSFGSLPSVHSHGGGGSSSTVRRSVSGSLGSCDIKGNISVDTGEYIYHVPGQRYYDETRINRLYGERWFCSEAEARAAGWRRSKV
jgi:hypothetical protein